MTWQTDSGFLKVIDDCSPALTWLNRVEPVSIDEVPSGFAEQIKQLEKLALVFKRNNKTLELRRQRLRKVVQHELDKLGRKDFAPSLDKYRWIV